MNPIVFAGARNELKRVNDDLFKKYGILGTLPLYRVQLQQYRHRDMDTVVYDSDNTNTNKYDIILCLYREKQCVSSVVGRLGCSAASVKRSMEMLSKTDVNYEGMKYNLYLRAVFIYLMYFVRPTVDVIYSHSTNPVSTYTMYKHFGATNPELEKYVASLVAPMNRIVFTIDDAQRFHDHMKKHGRLDPESAKKELDEMLEDYGETFGMECSVGDLGWDTTEEAIEFIMETMSYQAITLRVNLGESNMLHKWSTIRFKC